LSFLIGTAMGSISGYYGGRVDNAIQRFIELFALLSPDSPVAGPLGDAAA